MFQDLLDARTFADGHPVELYRRLREESPVHWNPEPDGPGFWALTRHADVRSVDRDFQAFSSEPTILIPDGFDGAMFPDAKMMLMMDPPEHTAFRKVIRSEFTRPAAEGKETRLRQLARQIVNEVIERASATLSPRWPVRCRPM